MQTITFDEAVKIIIESDYDLDKKFISAPHKHLKEGYKIIGFDPSKYEIIGESKQYRFYRYNDEYTILEEFPMDETNHYLILCDAECDEIGAIGQFSDSPDEIYSQQNEW